MKKTSYFCLFGLLNAIPVDQCPPSLCAMLWQDYVAPINFTRNAFAKSERDNYLFLFAVLSRFYNDFGPGGTLSWQSFTQVSNGLQVPNLRDRAEKLLHSTIEATGKSAEFAGQLVGHVKELMSMKDLPYSSVTAVLDSMEYDYSVTFCVETDLVKSVIESIQLGAVGLYECYVNHRRISAASHRPFTTIYSDECIEQLELVEKAVYKQQGTCMHVWTAFFKVISSAHCQQVAESGNGFRGDWKRIIIPVLEEFIQCNIADIPEETRLLFTNALRWTYNIGTMISTQKQDKECIRTLVACEMAGETPFFCLGNFYQQWSGLQRLTLLTELGNACRNQDQLYSPDQDSTGAIKSVACELLYRIFLDCKIKPAYTAALSDLLENNTTFTKHVVRDMFTANIEDPAMRVRWGRPITTAWALGPVKILTSLMACPELMIERLKTYYNVRFSLTPDKEGVGEEQHPLFWLRRDHPQTLLRLTTLIARTEWPGRVTKLTPAFLRRTLCKQE